MNARPPCLASRDEAAHAARQGDDEAASEFWAAQAERTIRAALVLQQPSDWFACRIPSPNGGWSPDELLIRALDCDDEPVRTAFSRLMVGQASADELRTALVDFALEHISLAVAMEMERQARKDARHAD